MERDSLGRYLTVNSPDVSMYASHQDLWHFAPDDRRTVGFAICLLVLVLTTTTTGMRIYTRLRITRAMGVDDWAMAASQVSLFIYSGIMIPGYLYGTGLHRAQMTFTNAELALRVSPQSHTNSHHRIVLTDLTVLVPLLRRLRHRHYSSQDLPRPLPATLHPRLPATSVPLLRDRSLRLRRRRLHNLPLTHLRPLVFPLGPQPLRQRSVLLPPPHGPERLLLRRVHEHHRRPVLRHHPCPDY